MRNYENGVPRHLNNFVTGNETLLYYYNIRSKHNNQVVIENESTLTQVRSIFRSIKEKMIIIFFMVKSILTRIVPEN